ncbi:MAG: CPBP family intramembrane glutamic endopeptidase [Phycisphaerae bacterium]|nr:CPBP family intramembrane glutamic endopeptidase [Phycisphaerae bacterium]
MLVATIAGNAGAEVIAAPDAIDHATSVREVVGKGSELWTLVGYIAAAIAIAVAVVLVKRRRTGSLVEPGVVPVARSAPFLAVGFFGLLFAQILGATIAAKLFGGATEEGGLRSGAIVMLGGYAIQLPVAAAIALSLPRLHERTARALRTGVVAGVFAIILIWPFVQIASVAAGMVQQVFTREPPPSLGHETLSQLARGAADPWAIVVIACVVFLAPVIEEIGYRGALQGAIRSAGTKAWFAIAITSGVFVVMHIPAIPSAGLGAGILGLFVLALGLGALRERTQSLIPCIVAHSLFNVVNLLLAGAFGSLIGTLPGL